MNANWLIACNPNDQLHSWKVHKGLPDPDDPCTCGQTTYAKSRKDDPGVTRVVVRWPDEEGSREEKPGEG